MVAIAVIIWAVIIICVAEAGTPGLILVILITMAIYGALYFAYVKIEEAVKARMENRRKKKRL